MKREKETEFSCKKKKRRKELNNKNLQRRILENLHIVLTTKANQFSAFFVDASNDAELRIEISKTKKCQRILNAESVESMIVANKFLFRLSVSVSRVVVGRIGFIQFQIDSQQLFISFLLTVRQRK